MKVCDAVYLVGSVYSEGNPIQTYTTDNTSKTAGVVRFPSGSQYL